MPPTFIQRLFLAILPQSWSTAMVRESQSWMVRCPCGHAMSVWDRGGIRWLAAGNPRRLCQCPACGEMTWHQVVKEACEAANCSEGR